MPKRLFRAANVDRNRFVALYLALVIGLLAAAAAFIREARVIVADGIEEEVAVQVLGAANRAQLDLENAETGQRGYLLTGQESYLSPYYQGTRDVDDTILQLQRVVSNDERSIDTVRRIEHTKNDKVNELSRTIDYVRNGERQRALALVETGQGKAFMDALRDDFSKLTDDWRARRERAAADVHRRVVFGATALCVLAVFTVGLLVYAMFVQRRAFARVSAYSEAMDRAAGEDPLTNLPNRRALLSAIDALSARPDARAVRVAVFYLDIDGFKAVNDALGHTAGDALLVRLARVLQSATRQRDILARVGGDEFVVLMVDCGDDNALRELAGRLIARVREVGQAAFDGRFRIGVSIGIATYPDHAATIPELLDIADAAMYAAKRSGRSTYRFGPSPVIDPSNVVRLTR